MPFVLGQVAGIVAHALNNLFFPPGSNASTLPNAVVRSEENQERRNGADARWGEVVKESARELANGFDSRLTGAAAGSAQRAFQVSVSALLLRLTSKIAPSQLVLTTMPVSFAGALVTLYKLMHFGVRLWDSIHLIDQIIKPQPVKKPIHDFRSIGTNLLGALAAASGALWGIMLINITYAFLGITVHQTVQNVSQSSSTATFIGLIIPIFINADREEIIFRRLILGSLQKKMRPWLANAIQASLFTLTHYGASMPGGAQAGWTDTSLSGAPLLFVLGLIFGHTYRKRGYVSALVAHAVFNLAVAITKTPSVAGQYLILGLLVLGAVLGALKLAPGKQGGTKDTSWSPQLRSRAPLLFKDLSLSAA
jgi:membrane protease YdiL (CAAX protease family)